MIWFRYIVQLSSLKIHLTENPYSTCILLGPNEKWDRPFLNSRTKKWSLLDVLLPHCKISNYKICVVADHCFLQKKKKRKKSINKTLFIQISLLLANGQEKIGYTKSAGEKNDVLGQKKMSTLKLIRHNICFDPSYTYFALFFKISSSVHLVVGGYTRALYNNFVYWVKQLRI